MDTLAQHVTESRSFDQSVHPDASYIEVQVTGQKSRNPRTVCFSIVQCFFELSDAKVVVAAAFEMKIVNRENISHHMYFRGQSNAAA